MQVTPNIVLLFLYMPTDNPSEESLPISHFDLPRLESEKMGILAQQLHPLGDILDPFLAISPIPISRLDTACDGFIYQPLSRPPIIVVSYKDDILAVLRHPVKEGLELTAVFKGEYPPAPLLRTVDITNDTIVRLGPLKRPFQFADIRGTTVTRQTQKISKNLVPADLMVVFMDCAAGPVDKPQDMVFAANIFGNVNFGTIRKINLVQGL